MSVNRVLKEAITAFYDGLMDKLRRHHADDYPGLIANWREIHTLYLEHTNDFLSQWADEPKQITAETVVIEVTDRQTGRTFRRTLPLGYLETDNGIKLSGDTLEGKPAHLAFLSETGVSRMEGILGKGPDEHHCGD